MIQSKKIEIGDEVTIIRDGAFCGMWDNPFHSQITEPQIEEVIIGKNVSEIESWAFGYSRTITSVIIPNGVTSIGKQSFYTCLNLPSITIPDSVTSIGIRAFSNCNSLNSITYKGVSYTSKSALEAALTDNGVILGNNVFSGTALTD